MLLLNRYQYNPGGDLLGKGLTSRVYKALDQNTNKHVALKLAKLSEPLNKEEQDVIKSIDHKNLIHYQDIHIIEKEDAFGETERIQVLIMELAADGNGKKFYEENRSPENLQFLLSGVLDAISYLHQKGIAHKNIKPSNVLICLTEGQPVVKLSGIESGFHRLSDFNFSFPLPDDCYYFSPDQLNTTGAISGNDFSTDIWRLGVTAFEIITGEVLFKNGAIDSVEKLRSQILRKELPEKMNALNAPCKEFIESCLLRDAAGGHTEISVLRSILSAFSPKASLVESKPETDDTGVLTNEQLHNIREIEDNPAISQEPDTENTSILSNVQLKSIIVLGEEQDTAKHAEASSQITDPADNGAAMPGNASSPGNQTSILAEAGKPNQPGEEDDTSVLSDLLKNKKQQLSDQADAAAAPHPGGMVNDDDTTVFSGTEKKADADPDSAIESNDVKIPADNSGVAAALNTFSGTGANAPKEEGKVVLFNRYEYSPVSDLIGKGGFSRVYKAYDKKLHRWVALKIYKSNDLSDRYSPFAEIQRVINLDHGNICRYLDIEELINYNAFGEKETTQVCVMELMDSGNITEYYSRNKDENTLKKLITDIIKGLSYLHRNGIIHRDIKPANILIKETIEGPVAKITDFGISKATDSVNSNSSSTLIVSIPFMAPEQLNVKRFGINQKISFNLDFWSLGVTIYEIYTGKVLFKDSDNESSEKIMINIMAPGLPDKINDLPPLLKQLVSRCLVKNASERVQSASELLDILNNNSGELPFIEKREVQVKETSNVLPDQKKGVDPEVTEPKKPRMVFSVDEPMPVKSASGGVRLPLMNRRQWYIAGGSLLLLIIVILLMNRVSCNNAITTVDTDSLKDSVLPIRETNIVPGPPETNSNKDDSTNLANVDSAKNEPVVKKETKKDPAQVKTSQPKKTEKTNSVFHTLKMVTERKYSITIEGGDRTIRVEIAPGEEQRFPLKPGQYIIRGVPESGGKEYQKIFLVKEYDIGRSSKIELP
ncbi:MAG: serine/threonine-protein kinase [Chitinophagaceae bacterium]|nr:serine/threonine-protein kinase [Chitinophagaceae bacterium]